MQKSVSFQPNVDKGNLHTGKDVLYTTLIGVVKRMLVIFAFNINLGQNAIFKYGTSRFIFIVRNDHLFLHCRLRP